MKIIVDGLDCVGKTTFAKRISENLSLPYLKIRKTCCDGRTREETVNNIIDEISNQLGDYWKGVLDRGYWSAIGTNLASYENFNPSEIKKPRNLFPDLGLLVLSNPTVILERNTKKLTEQDKRVLGGNFLESQNYLKEYAIAEGYQLIDNSSKSISDLENYANIICDYVNENLGYLDHYEKSHQIKTRDREFMHSFWDKLNRKSDIKTMLNEANEV